MLRVIYSCGLCGISERPVLVRYREPGESVTAFMEQVVMQALADDHHRSSPRCRPATLTEVKIPIPDGTEGIGERPVT